MLNIRDLFNNTKARFSAFEAAKVKIAVKIATDLNSAAIVRLIETGELDDGSKLEYAESTKKTKIRKGRNRSPFPIMNFVDDAEMLESTLPQVSNVTKDSVEIDIKPLRPDRAEVMGYLEDKIGKKLILPTDKERANLLEDFKDELDKFFNFN